MPNASAAKPPPALSPADTAAFLKREARRLGFQQLGIASVDLGRDGAHLERWLALGRHGEMDYMARHHAKRRAPAELVPGTLRVVSLRMDYWPANARDAGTVLDSPERAYVARYALGRDYHKVLRGALKRLAAALERRIGPFGYRVFVDSAPVLEKALARNAGLGWIGKHTNLINKRAGSWFVLGELFTDLPLPVDKPARDHCGSCSACLDVCPTGAIVAPYELDARRCISYLTIEQKGSIPLQFRRAIGNRVFGCDDCQLVCPWNKFAQATEESDFTVRHGLDDSALIALFRWSELQWSAHTAGSAIRRAGYVGWLRNLAVALGNAPRRAEIVAALRERELHVDPIVREHVDWGLKQQLGAAAHPP
jgi:epoxyqueuosine reductase